MKELFFSALLIITVHAAISQSKFPKNAVSINGFRNPSIGVEYHHNQLSVHGGYYVTNFTQNTTTQFLKTGITYWFLPIGKQEIPSSFYVGASFLRGLNNDYNGKSAFATEAGFRWMIWKGFNFRIGVIALAAKGEPLQINPTPGISYSFKF